MRAQLDGLSGKKREQLEAKIAKWESLITSTETKVTEAETELAAINTQISDIDTALVEQQAICGGTTPTLGTGTFYLHADHLGRPQFATDSDGVVVWDMGDQVTPFGQGVNLAGAFAQKLMFPGQYADEETGEEITISHNWHRTYDPTLGRYLQSDPIGLAGGLNRYVYGLGDPVSNIDPDGRIVPLLIPMLWGAVAGAALDVAFQVFYQKTPLKCLNMGSVATSALLGALPVGNMVKGAKMISAQAALIKGTKRIGVNLGNNGIKAGSKKIGKSLAFNGGSFAFTANVFEQDCECIRSMQPQRPWSPEDGTKPSRFDWAIYNSMNDKYEPYPY